MRKLFLVSLATLLLLGVVPHMFSADLVQAQPLELLFEIQISNAQYGVPDYSSWGFEILGDINNDGREDLVTEVRSAHPMEPGIMIIDGRTGGMLAFVSTPATSGQVGFRDFDGDGIDELLFITSSPGVLKVYKWVESPVPVTLSLFTAERRDEDVIIRWEVNDFVYDQVEFRVFRDNMEITRSPLSGEKSYEFADENVPMGEISYFLEESDASGARHLHGPIKVGKAPMRPMSLTAHPNPFNPSVNVSYTVPERGTVSLEVYDVHGRLVETLVHNEPREPKRYELTYKPEKSSGVYFVRLEAGGQVKSRKIVLLK